jgi:ubiquinone/menaquinone biosynthesis C-methylase UbiE
MQHLYRVAAGLICLSALAPAQPLPSDVSPEAVRAEERERDRREKVHDVAAALAIKAGSVIADIGTGYGYYAVRLAPLAGPSGRIIAQEIDRPLVEKLRARVSDEKLTNVDPLLGAPHDPGLATESADAILVADVYHEVENQSKFLELLRISLKAGGRLMIIDYLKPEIKNQSRERQREQHNIAPAFVLDDLKAAGYTILGVRDPYAPGFDDIPTYWVLAEKR